MSEENKQKCVVCKEMTPVIFGINMKPVPLCDNCANQITVQQVQDLINKANFNI